MEGIEHKYCDVCINAVIGAWRALMEATGTETLRTTPYGKGDTLGLDAITEITIKGRLAQFDSHAFLITEELDEQSRRRWPSDSDPIKQPLMFFCDPTDRSNQLRPFFESLSKDNPTAKIGDLMKACDARKKWETMFEAPVAITGPTSAITCVRKGEIVFSVILNLVTASLCVVTDAGVYFYQLGDYSDRAGESVNLDTVFRKGRIIRFHCAKYLKYTADDCKRFVTFLGKSGYKENFDESKLFTEDSSIYLHHNQPPGPPRVLYLSELQKGHGSIGFILANGEKIGEWMHWLSFVKFATTNGAERVLRAFEISLERPRTKNGMLMSTSHPYSIFSNGQNGQRPPYLDMSQLRNFDRPSQFRCMLLVTPRDNERIIHVLEQHQYREVTEFF